MDRLIKKKQVNLDLNNRSHRILMFLSEKTESVSTNGINKGKPSPAAMLRRICDGEISLYYEGKKVDIPLNIFFDL
jgi:hypothetical protein